MATIARLVTVVEAQVQGMAKVQTFLNDLEAKLDKNATKWAAVGSFIGNLGATAVTWIAGAAVNAVQGLVRNLDDMVARGAAVDGVQRAFRALTQSIGQSGDEMLRVARTATKGLIADFDLMAAANKAILLGLPITSQQFGTLGQAAIILGRAMKLDAATAMNDLITALGRSSPLILDNLGLTVKIGEATQLYAQQLGKNVTELTDAEKKLAFYTAATQVAATRVKDMGDVHLTFSDRLSIVKVGMQNVTDAIGVAIATSPHLNAAVSVLGQALLSAFGTNQEQSIRVIGQAINTAATFVVGTAQAIVGFGQVGLQVFGSMRLAGLSVLSVFVDLAVGIGETVAKNLEMAAALPGVSLALGGVAKTARDNVTQLQDLAAKTHGNIDAAKKMSTGTDGLSKALGAAEQVLDQMKQEMARAAAEAKNADTATQSLTRAQDTAAVSAKGLTDEEKKLRDELSGAKLQGELDRLVKVWHMLTPAQQQNEQVIQRVIAEYNKLRGGLAPGALPRDLELLRIMHGNVEIATQTMAQAVSQLSTQALPGLGIELQKQVPIGNVVADIFKTGIPTGATLTNAAIKGMGQGFDDLKQKGTSLSDAIGTMAGAIASTLKGTAAAVFDLAKIWANAIQGMVQAFSSGNVIGGIVALGTAIVSTIGKLLGLGPSAAEQAATIRNEFLATYPSFTELERKAQLAGISLKGLFTSSSPNTVQTAIDNINAGLRAWEQRVKDIESAAAGLTKRVEGWLMPIKAVVDALDKAKKEYQDLMAQANPDPLKMAEAQKAVDDLTKKLIDMATKGQAEFDRMGQFTVAVFGAILKETGSLVQAFNAVGPAIDALIYAEQHLGLQATGTVKELMAIRQVIQQNQDVATSADGLTQVIKGMGAAGQLNQTLFNAMGADAKALYDTLIQRGVPANQALLIMQPTLQALWDAQRRFGFEVDDSTQNLINMGVEAGVVGSNFSSVGDQMLRILTDIRDLIAGGVTRNTQNLGDEFDRQFRRGKQGAVDIEAALAKIPNYKQITINYNQTGNVPAPGQAASYLGAADLMATSGAPVRRRVTAGTVEAGGASSEAAMLALLAQHEAQIALLPGQIARAVRDGLQLAKAA